MVFTQYQAWQRTAPVSTLQLINLLQVTEYIQTVVLSQYTVEREDVLSYAALDLYTQPIMSSASFIAIIIIQSSDHNHNHIIIMILWLNHAFSKANHNVHTLLHKLIKWSWLWRNEDYVGRFGSGILYQAGPRCLRRPMISSGNFLVGGTSPAN